MFRTHECAACKAKDQTIALLADLVDWHRAQGVISVPNTPQLSTAASIHTPQLSEPTFAAPGELWASDEEELIYAALESGEMTSEQGEKALSSLQAQNTIIQLVK